MGACNTATWLLGDLSARVPLCRPGSLARYPHAVRLLCSLQARSENVTVLGECVEVKDTVCLNGVRVLPHKAVKDSQFVEGTIIM